MHKSVLLNECLDLFAPKKLDYFVDATLGMGGHAAALLTAHPEITRYIGFDQDPYAREIARNNLAQWEDTLTIIPKNFRDLKEALAAEGIPQVSGILMDLGVSSLQLDTPERGFSFSKDGPLDMRMDPESLLTAEDIVNTWTEKELKRIFKMYGEEPHAALAAQTIVKARDKMPITTTAQLASLLKERLQFKSKGKSIHPATLVFQALRIVVNGELEAIESAVQQALSLLMPGGRLAIISFHSLEDRIVKHAFIEAASDKESTSGIGGLFKDKIPTVTILTRKPITPSEEETTLNPRARSAKLRAAERLCQSAS